MIVSGRRPEAPALRDRPGWTRPAVVALLPLVCVVLGGGVERWSEAVVLLGLGGLLLAMPPRASLGRGVNFVLAGLLLLGGTAFLPARWFALPAWRRAFVEDFGATLPGTLSPQPWLSAETLVVFLAGVSWLYLMATMPWKRGERRRAGQVFAAGVAALAGVFVLLAQRGVIVPIWPNVRHFGPFPNRNQTADFLAVGALPVLALARAAWRGGRVRGALGWLTGWLLAAVAVFQCFSRAGIAILFISTALYLGVEFFRAARRPPANQAEAKFAPWRRVALLVSLVLVATSVFLAVGGDTLERMRPGSVYAETNTVSNDLRRRLQADAVSMTNSAPWCGVGLGNFAGLFEIFRRQSADAPLRSIHPESDWLWLAAEMGWPALALTVAGCVLLGRRMWPERQSHDRPLRTAAALAVAAFAVHGLFDVSAHRLGTAMCGLFLAGLALPGNAESEGAKLAPVGPGWPVVVFRVLGVGFLGVGILWMTEARGGWVLPGAQGISRLETAALGQGQAHDYADAQGTATRALAWAPLNWELYFIRAGAGVYLRRDLEATGMDFRRARFLERCSPTAPLDEARLWAAVGQNPQTVNAVLEACRRAPARPGDFIGPINLLRGGDPDYVDLLGAAVLRHPELAVSFTEHLEGTNLADFIARVLQSDPDLARLDAGQKLRLFRAWALKGDPQTLASGMASHPGWQSLGWRWWAEACGRVATPETWRQACQIAASHAPKPDVPTINDSRSLVQLQRADLGSSDDAALALALSRAQQTAGDPDAAARTLHRMAIRPGSPAYFSYLEAQLAMQTDQWQTGWDAWRRYLSPVAVN